MLIGTFPPVFFPGDQVRLKQVRLGQVETGLARL